MQGKLYKYSYINYIVNNYTFIYNSICKINIVLNY